MEATTTKKKAEKEYAMLAVNKDFHREVKAFCAANGYSMIAFVETVLGTYIKRSKSKGY